MLVRRLGTNTLGLRYAVAMSDFLLAPATPSNAARSGGTIYSVGATGSSAPQVGTPGRRICFQGEGLGKFRPTPRKYLKLQERPEKAMVCCSAAPLSGALPLFHPPSLGLRATWFSCAFAAAGLNIVHESRFHECAPIAGDRRAGRDPSRRG
jgi:Sodium:sulfate symporter transmembrane region